LDSEHWQLVDDMMSIGDSSDQVRSPVRIRSPSSLLWAAAARARGALVHRLRHTFATSSNSEVGVYTLMKLLKHESMVTSQRYVTAADTETRAAAAQNTLYDLVKKTGEAERVPHSSWSCRKVTGRFRS
jgi:integrase